MVEILVTINQGMVMKRMEHGEFPTVFLAPGRSCCGYIYPTTSVIASRVTSENKRSKDGRRGIEPTSEFGGLIKTLIASSDFDRDEP